jgi:hypothetical protein
MGRHKKDCTCELCEKKRGEFIPPTREEINNALPQAQQTQQIPTVTPLAASETVGAENSVHSELEALINATAKDSKTVILADPAQVAGNVPAAPTFKASNYIKAYMLINFLDFVLPGILVMLFSMFDKSYKKIDKSELRTTEQQKKDLEIAVNYFINMYLQNVPEWLMAFGAIMAVYGGNLMAAHEKMRISEEKKSKTE